jgi:hypothetical protein
MKKIVKIERSYEVKYETEAGLQNALRGLLSNASATGCICGQYSYRYSHSKLAKSKEPSEDLQKALTLLRMALPVLEHDAPELPPGHICGPESNCDGHCANVYAANMQIEEIRIFLKEYGYEEHRKG